MAQGRMIDKKISVSEQVANLQLPAQLLFTWMILHADDLGLLPTSARTIKALVIPMIDGITAKDVEEYIKQMLEEKLLDIVHWNNEDFYHLTGFDNQKLRKDIKPHSIASGVTEWSQVETVMKQSVTDTERVVTDTEQSDVQVKRREVKLREENISKDNIMQRHDVADSLNELIALFEPVNPSYERLFANKTQRTALQRLVDKYGYSKTRGAIRAVTDSYGKPFAPQITTPIQLETKLGALIAYVKQQESSKPIIAIMPKEL